MPMTMLPLAATALAAAVEAHGEIVVIEGSAATVSGSPGAWYVDLGGNIDAILTEFYSIYPDEFDMVSIWTTFPDMANGGAYFTTPPPVASRLIGFINMNQVGFWTGFDALSTLGQEFAHAWLMWEVFVDPTTGMVSDELIGRQGAHWSSLVDTEGSVVDGVDWVDNGDGTFTVAGVMNKLGPVDLWVMGYIEASEVPPFFLLRDAPFGPLGIWEGLGVGTTVSATKVPLTIQDIIAAEGPQPPIDMRQKDYRVAFVLLTAPGESAASAVGQAQQIDQIRGQWDQIFVEWTWGRGTMCTDVSAPCDIPRAAFAGARVREGARADGDGVVEPGEDAAIEVDWRNTGNAVATGAMATLDTGDTGITAPAPLPVPDVAVGGVATTTFELTLPKALACGREVVFTARAALGARQWKGTIAMIPGVIEGPVESFATDGGWRANVDGADTAQQGGWEYGVAEQVQHNGLVLQPAGGRGGPDDRAWWTGRAMGFDWNQGDVDGGFTRLVSAPYDVQGLVGPVLRYHVWYQAWNFMVTPPTPAQADELLVEVSADDGATWTEVDRVSGEARAWERREVPLAAKLPGGAKTVRFRFTAEDVPPTQNLVEVGIDDVQIYSLSPACGDDGGGCGCRAGGRPRGGTALAPGLVAALALARRRRGR